MDERELKKLERRLRNALTSGNAETYNALDTIRKQEDPDPKRYTYFDKVDLSGLVLDGFIFERIVFTDLKLDNTIFKNNVVFHDAEIRDSVFDGCRFDGTFNDVGFWSCTFSTYRFEGITFRKTSFISSTVGARTRFIGCRLSGLREVASSSWEEVILDSAKQRDILCRKMQQKIRVERPRHKKNK